MPRGGTAANESVENGAGMVTWVQQPVRRVGLSPRMVWQTEEACAGTSKNAFKMLHARAARGFFAHIGPHKKNTFIDPTENWRCPSCQ